MFVQTEGIGSKMSVPLKVLFLDHKNIEKNIYKFSSEPLGLDGKFSIRALSGGRLLIFFEPSWLRCLKFGMRYSCL